jgi:hypothetical protein
MKKQILVAVLALMLAPGLAHAVSFGVAAFGGTSTPVVQDDTGSGSLFGARVPVNFVPLITVEPYYASTSGGNKDYTAAGLSYTRDGIDVTSYGANVLFEFGTGVRLFPFVGLSSNHLKRSGLDETETGYDFGLGVGFKLPLAGLGADVRGALNMVTDPASSAASRKWAEITVGVSYSFLHIATP